MSRVRLFSYGPTVKSSGYRNQRTKVSDIKYPSRFGVILRTPPKLSHELTNKSVLAPKVFKGIRPPGYSPPNYPSPLN